MKAEFAKVGANGAGRADTPEEAKTKLVAWEKLKKLGGLKTFFDCGGDCEMLNAGPAVALEFIESSRMIERFDVDA